MFRIRFHGIIDQIITQGKEKDVYNCHLAPKINLGE